VVSSADLWKMNTLSTDETPFSAGAGHIKKVSQINRGGCVCVSQTGVTSSSPLSNLQSLTIDPLFPFAKADLLHG